jgi:hypothetical protein
MGTLLIPYCPTYIGLDKVACLRSGGRRRRRRVEVDQRRGSHLAPLQQSVSTMNPTGDHAYVALALV